jgi:hypothetical protein
MASQIKYGTPSADYCVVDNSAAPTYPSLSAGTSLGYDTTWPGSQTQDSNPFSNGTIPDAVNSSTVILNNSYQSTRLLYKNPA